MSLQFPTRKLVQISEEALPPVHAPVIIDNQFYILSQQDVRKLEDYRLLTVHKLMPNGELKCLNYFDNDILLQYLQQQNSNCQQNLLVLNEFVNSKLNKAVHSQAAPQPMETSENETKASITQQLQWDKCTNRGMSFPMKYSCGTSTTEIKTNREQCLRELRALNSCSCCKSKHMCNKSTATQAAFHDCKQFREPMGAREELKQKKINNTLY